LKTKAKREPCKKELKFKKDFKFHALALLDQSV